MFGQNQVVFAPYHADGIYHIGEMVGWTAKTSANNANTRYTYVIKRNNKDIVKTGAFDLAAGPARLEVRADEPAMILVEVEPEHAALWPTDKGAKQEPAGPGPKGKKPAPETMLGAAIEPTKLLPSAARPKDFMKFWKENLAALAKIPIDPVLTPVRSDKSGADLYTVTLDSVGSHVHGYLATPAKPGKHPALIMFQYAGVYKLDPDGVLRHAQDGWLALDVDSHDMSPTEDSGVPTDYYTIGNKDKKTSYFLKMYLRDTRAVDYIRSRPDWDGKTIVLTGSSMGGQQSLVTAGLNGKLITAVIVDEPSGADTNGDLHGRKAGYPYWPSSDPDVMRTSLYFDPVNFAPMIKAKTILAVGFIDTTAPPAGIWTVFNQIHAPKEIVPMIESAHNNLTPDKQMAFKARSQEALADLLRGKPLSFKKQN
jgi:cephalosporin-C deacetylase-like acetyl esterase